MDLAHQLHVRARIGEQVDEFHLRIGPLRATRGTFATRRRSACSRAARGAPSGAARKAAPSATPTVHCHDDRAAAVGGGELGIRTVLQQQLHELDVAGIAGREERRHATIG